MKLRYRVAAAACLALIASRAAPAELANTLQKIGADKDALGNDMRVMEFAPRSIKHSADGVSVNVVLTSQSHGTTGYNCADGEIRHGNTPKAVASLLCPLKSAASPYAPHEPRWATLTSAEQVDLDSVNRIGDEVIVHTMAISTSRQEMRFDCRGYFSYRAGASWQSLDTTDHIPTNPGRTPSLERRLSERVCSTGSP